MQLTVGDPLVNLLIPLEAGLLWFGSAFYVHPGTANWKLNFVPPARRSPCAKAGHCADEVEFFCRLKCTWTAGSLTSTYRVVRKYNF